MKKINCLRDYLAGLRESKANLPNSGSSIERMPIKTGEPLPETAHSQTLEVAVVGMPRCGGLTKV